MRARGQHRADVVAVESSDSEQHVEEIFEDDIPSLPGEGGVAPDTDLLSNHDGENEDIDNGLDAQPSGMLVKNAHGYATYIIYNLYILHY